MYIMFLNTATRMSLGEFMLLLFLTVLTLYYYQQDDTHTPGSIGAIVKRLIKSLAKAMLTMLPYMAALALLSG